MERSGYSGRPLYLKLGFKETHNILICNKPDNYLEWLEAPFELPIPNAKDLFDAIHLFSKEREELKALLAMHLPQLQQNGMIWISWPKKASKVITDITEDVVRAEIFPLGMVDIKVCSVSPIWSGLKVVIRKENRK